VGIAGGFLLVFAVTAGLTPLLMSRAASWRRLAQPSDRRLHSGAIPLVGGLAMGLAFLVAYVMQMPVTDGLQPIAVAGANQPITRRLLHAP
jgi:UDP-N-acetylmuramyl pentapeptide phosphotransferase/UDP-N-acetylglucosamine-1-phosphate transferase